MTFRLYLYIMAVASAAAWIGWIFVVNVIDPVNTSYLGFFLFYFTLSIALIGTLTFFGTTFRAWLAPDGVPARQTEQAFRHSILFTVLILTALLLAGSSLLRWWSILLLVVFIGFVEMIFLSSKKRS